MRGRPPLSSRYSTASATSAKASAAASCEGSFAIEGCICANVMSSPLRSASRSRPAEAAESSPPGPRQRVSEYLASPSCSQIGRAVPGAGGDDVMGVLVRRRVEPVVALHERLRRHDHELVELAERDGAGGLDLLVGERREPRQLAGVVQDLDDHLARRRPAEVVLERLPLRLQRVEHVRGEDLVLALRIRDDEVLALGPGVVLRDVASRSGEREIVESSRREATLLEQLDRLAVALLVVAHQARHRHDAPVLPARLHEWGDERLRLGDVLVLECGDHLAEDWHDLGSPTLSPTLSLPGRGRGGHPLAPRQRGEGWGEGRVQRQDDEGHASERSHFTSSS